MTNREWLNTLSDEDYAEEWLKIEKMLHGDCGFHIEVIVEWLSQPHETSADEDFAKIGFELFGYGNDLLTYRPIGLHLTSGFRQLVIHRDKNIYNGTWTDKTIDQIRTIADKKRKEVWGNIHDKEVE